MDTTACSHTSGGQAPYTFTLKIKYDGRVDLSSPVRYLGGKTWDYKIDPYEDEWGFITLQEKFFYLDYCKEDNFGFFTVKEGALVELLTDLDACTLIQARPKEVEIWVLRRVIDYNDVQYEKFNDIHVAFRGTDVELTDVHGITIDGGTDHGKSKIYEVEDDEEINLSDEREIVSSDEDVETNVWDNVRPPIQNIPTTIWLARTFKTKADFKEAVEEYAVNEGKELRFVKNDKGRCTAKCTQEDCKWKVTATKDKVDLRWRITTFNDKHAGCPWIKKNKFITAALVAKRWRAELGRNSEWKMEEFRETACTTDHYQISKRQAYKAMTLAKTGKEGETNIHFNRIWSYFDEIKKTNPNTTINYKLSSLDCEVGKQRLMRVYICWEAFKEGFKYCRPIIGVDGCHLRSKYGGMLLTAVGMDANESLFPIAYAIVEGESRDSWSWFLELLRKDLMITPIGEQNFTFMSDKQKGLIPAFEDVFPHVSNRFCVRHLQGNMKLAGFTGTPIHDALWKAARATTVNTFTTAMTELKDLDGDAFQWLNDKLPSEWSRAYFTNSAKSDILVNNICESFNAMILDARKVPLINCLELLRKKVMVRLFKCRQHAENWSGKICPVIMKKISVNERQAGGYWTYQSEKHLFEVSGAHDQHQVDLRSRTCSCRKWELTGIPCRHAIAAIWMEKGKIPVLDFVDSCYTVEKYLSCYAGCIHPIAGHEEWPLSDREPPLPPLYKAKVGRPRTLRKKSAHELTKDGVHVSRKHMKSSCSLCKQVGHNIRRCPQNPNRQARPQRRDRPPVRQPAREEPVIGQPGRQPEDILTTTQLEEIHTTTQPEIEGQMQNNEVVNMDVDDCFMALLLSTKTPLH